MLGLAIVDATRGNYGEALEALKRVLSAYPEVPTIRSALGVCYYKLGHLDIAGLCFERALVLGP